MSNRGVVYSTGSGRTCPDCGNPAAGCTCTSAVPAPAVPGGRIRISRSTGGRNGRAVIVISGIPLPPDRLKALAKELKQKCGSGGTAKDGTIEIQGEHLQTLAAELTARGFRVTASGG